MRSEKSRNVRHNISRAMLMIVCFLLVTVLVVLIAAYSVMAVLALGPSPTARALFVRSVRETSAVGFLADIFFTPEQIAQIELRPVVEEIEDSDPSLIVPVAPPEGNAPDAWGFVDEDGDGIILDTVRGEGYNGYMMIVLDPSRVVMASVPGEFGIRGYTVEEMVKKFDAVAGINAGGFDDPEGRGNGSVPITTVVYGGKIYYPGYGTASGFAGFDADHILHVGRFGYNDLVNRNIQNGVAFGPVLIANGELSDRSILASGVSARTGIGQRSDGAVLMLLIEGRQVTSLGATYLDMAEVFLSYGAVNACNMDGGSSSMMWYGDGYVNKCASVVGIRRVPTTFIVLKQGGDTDA